MDSRFERVLNKVKGFRMKFENKTSLSNEEGEEGEFRVNKKNGVSTLYIKMDKKWVQLNYTTGSISEGIAGSIVDSTLDANGYVKYGNGLIIQWGSKTYTSNTTTQDLKMHLINQMQCIFSVGFKPNAGTGTMNQQTIFALLPLASHTL